MATIAIPVPVMLVLKGAGKIESLGLRNAYERRLPLLMTCILAYGGAEVLPDRTRIAGSNPMPCRRHRIAFYNIHFPVLGQDKPACNGHIGPGVFYVHADV